MAKLPLHKVKVDTSDYINVYGHRPSGIGYWGFSDKYDLDDNEIWWFNGLYSQCKNKAIHNAASRGSAKVYLQA